MKLNSFRTKITVNLIIVTATISFIFFYFYNYYLSKRIYQNSEKNIMSLMYFFKDQLYYSIHLEDGKIIRSFLKNIEENKMVSNAYLINSDGHIIYPSENSSLAFAPITMNELVISDEDKIIMTQKQGSAPFSRVLIHLRNSPNCYNCHLPSKKNLGYVVIDFSIKKELNNIAFTQKFSIIFTILMVLVIITFVIIMHYKFVRRSLVNFKQTIFSINRGNLDERLSIPVSKELGDLGRMFNEMLDNFQKTQKELQLYHQKELDVAQKMATIGEMAARLAHEIRNPMTGIANATEIIIKETKDEQNKPILKEIQRQAIRVNDAVSDLLKFSRSKEINLLQGNINSIIESLVFFLENQNKNNNIKFISVLQPDIPDFNFDPEQIENVLLNLGLNAIQAIDKNGTITFTTSYHDKNKHVKIAVEDNGPGIPDEVIADIFNPFFTTKTEGTGLGLAISKDIIEKHKGQICVQNKPDNGCIFYILLPVS